MLRFDSKGGIVKSYREIADALSDETGIITGSQVAGIMGRNRDIFPKDGGRPERELSTSYEAVRTRNKKAKNKELGIEPKRSGREFKAKKTDYEIVEEGENKLYIDSSKGKNPPRQWQRRQRRDDPKQKDFLLGQRLATDFLTSDNGWQTNEGVGIRGKSLLDLGNRECRYVVDDTEGNMLMCGNRIDSYPYCSKHSKFSYRASSGVKL